MQSNNRPVLGYRDYQPIDAESFRHDIELVAPMKPAGRAFDFSGSVDHDGNSKKKPSFFLSVALFCGALIFFSALLTTLPKAKSIEGSKSPVYPTYPDDVIFDSYGRYIMHNFDDKKPMSNFLSGLSGFWGVPMWTFYVNRGQGITSFGVQNKDGMIEKFQSAEKAYQLTPFTGFRTFVKGKRDTKSSSASTDNSFQHMPFFPKGLADINDEDSFTRNMYIGMNEMEIEEIAPSINLKTNVLYFNLPEEDFPSLVRRTTFTNLDSESTLTLDVLDGLDKLFPSGLSNQYVDMMGRLAEAYMNVYNVGDRRNIHEPFFHISQSTADTADVQVYKEGHFTVAFIEDDNLNSDGLHETIPFIVDPDVVFDVDTTLTRPSGFFGPQAPDAVGIASVPQVTTSRTPCSFAAAKLVLPPGASATLTTVYGHADSLETFVNTYSPKVRRAGYIKRKRVTASAIAEDITKRVATTTSSTLFNSYVKQDFLDNSLRGGLPLILGDPANPKIYHTFNRVHGDIERDYNWFNLEPTYFSQGPGNFRDVNQNRRTDILINPAVGDFDIRMFLSFVQADGYNPLTVATTNFRVPQEKAAALVSSLGIVEPLNDGSKTKALTSLLTQSFRFGQLFHDMKTANIDFTIDKNEFLNKVAAATDQFFAAAFMQNGYWADHWTYTLDLVESYLAVFPDKEQTLLWDSVSVPFYLSPAYVRPREKRYTLAPNKDKPGTSSIRVFSPVAMWDDADFPPEKKAEMLALKASPNYVGTPQGEGALWQRTKSGGDFTVTAISKLLLLGVVKFSTLDPYGMGIEMEGGKPGWNDAMNGLPGLIGSGMPETYEMLRILKYVNSVLAKYNRPVIVPAEFAELLTSINAALAVYDVSTKDLDAEFAYWDASNNAREKYRALTVCTFSGETVALEAALLVDSLTKMEKKTNGGINRALATNNGLSPTYFYYESTDYESRDSKIYAKKFALHTLPLFLEGPVRHMKIIEDQASHNEVYYAAKASGLYDTKLQMYTLSESLANIGPEIGRMKAFAPGWLENQSVFLHMSYKFLLELLRAGMYAEFFEEIKTGLVPFMNNNIYGRSPLEACSFIVSSAFPDPKLHGASFMPRLSGSTAEFLSMWLIMFPGKKPFNVDESGQLVLQFNPIIPGWLFLDDGSASFTFLGFTQVTYHNPTKADTWTTSLKTISLMYVDGTKLHLNDAVIRGSAAIDVRSQKVASIDAYF